MHGQLHGTAGLPLDAERVRRAARRPRKLAAMVAETVLRTVTGFGADRCGISAAGITYFALISIFPLLLVGLSVAGFVFHSQADQDRLLDFVVKRLPLEDSGRGDLASVVQSIVDARGTLGVFGILSGLYTGSALFTAVRVALNGVFHHEKPRPFFVGKLIDIGMVLLFGMLLALSSGASFAIAFMGRLAEAVLGDAMGPFLGVALGAAATLVGLLLSVALFLLLYTRIPGEPAPWKHAIPGAVLAALLFEALKVGFAQYAANFANYNATYGSLGFVVLLLAFIYFTSQVMLLGAEAARATDEVATGWPFPPAESRLWAVRTKVAQALGTVRRFGRRGEPGAGVAAAALTSTAAPPSEASSPQEPGKSPGPSAADPATRAVRREEAAWAVLAGVLLGLIGALAATRRK